MRCLITLIFAFCLTHAHAADHAAMIQSLGEYDAKAGAKLYILHCAACHGEDGNLALNPLARRFTKDTLKFGTDPYGLWKTISYGNGLMFRWDGVLSEKERYQIVHHLREDIIKPNNASQYYKADDAYYEGLSKRSLADAKAQAEDNQQVTAAPGMIDGSGGTRMIYGPYLQHAVAYGAIKDKNAKHIEHTTEKALLVDLPGDHFICYDAARLSVSGIWTGKLADTNDTHHASYKGSRPLRPGGEVRYQHIDAIGWEGGDLAFNGHYLQENHILLDYQVGDRAILETPSAEAELIYRHLQIGPGKDAVRCLLIHGDSHRLKPTLFLTNKSDGTIEPVEGGGQWLKIPPSTNTITLTIALGNGAATAASPSVVPDFDNFAKGGPRRWPTTVQTAVALGENVEGYAADELTVPLANPYGSWMRPTSLDFFSDGRMAVATLSGDVWIVHWTQDTPTSLTWSRYASGLYEPLGLKIVDDLVYVRGRDRITRLHDLNGNEEADHYESFYEDPNEIGASYHAFVYDLQTDDSGYFYFSQSGYKSPLEGAVVRLSPDGKHAEYVGTDLRNPNGMGAGGPNNWVTITDNPSGIAVYNGFSLVREGGRYGFEHPRNTPMLVVLPASVDSSSGGQCWSDPKRWGPLSGSIVHCSYSLSAVFYCLTQDLKPYPNGFAVRLPFDLKAGAMRPRINPIDGQAYIACKKGWDSVARCDGVIYRIRHTGKRSHLIQGAEATTKGIRLSFACDLDPNSIRAHNFTILREPDKPQKGAKLKHIPVGQVQPVNERSIEVTIPNIENEVINKRTTTNPQTGAVTVAINPAISLSLKLIAADGTKIEETIHATINTLPPAE